MWEEITAEFKKYAASPTMINDFKQYYWCGQVGLEETSHIISLRVWIKEDK